MTYVLILVTFLAQATFANDGYEIIEEGSTTRAIQQCDPITAINKKNNKRISAERCMYGFGGVGFDENNPPVFYNIGGKEVEEADFLRAFNVQSMSGQDQYKCDGKSGDDLQCLVCNCFFETGADGNTGRNISQEERTMVAKVVTSRVLNPNFANSVCGVVHERSASGRAQFSWIRLWNDNCADGSQNCRNEDPTDPNHKINTVLAPPSPQDNSPRANLIRSCTQAAKDALRERNNYFASYYLTPNAERESTWAQACREKYPMSTNRISASASGNPLSHVFFLACNDNESSLAVRSKAPTRPIPYPVPRPKGLNQQGLQ